MGNKEIIRAREKEIERWREEDKWLANKAKDRNEFPEVREQATALRVLLARPKIDILLLSNQCARIDTGTRVLKKIPAAGEWMVKDFYGNQVQEFEARIEALETGIRASKPDIRRALNALRLPQDHFLRTHSFGSDPVDRPEENNLGVSEAVPNSDETSPAVERVRRRKYHELGRLVRRICAYQRKRRMSNPELMKRIQTAIDFDPDRDTTRLQPPKEWNFGNHHSAWPEAYSCMKRHDGCATPCRKQVESFIAKLKSGDL